MCCRACADNDARLALLDKDPFQVQTKPHGHGDVHMLLHSSGECGQTAADARRVVSDQPLAWFAGCVRGDTFAGGLLGTSRSLGLAVLL